MVCEGCGDCSHASNCVSVVPLDTQFGVKRRIEQSSCNKDFSCVEGFCPSFVTVHGGSLRRRARVTPDDASLPEPLVPSPDAPWSMLVTGVGGTGVVTIGALLGMAAHTEGRHVSVLDITGLAQKGGSVWSNIRIAPAGETLHGLHVGMGQADVVLGADLVVTAGRDVLGTLRRDHTRVVLNTHESATADFVLDGSFRLPSARLRRSITEAAGATNLDLLDATAIAAALLGDAMGTNVFLLGYAWQKGLVPLRRESLLDAIELNATAVEANTAAFAWGRLAAADLPRVLAAAGLAEAPPPPRTLEEIVAHRSALLAGYQSRRYARRYRALVARVQEVEGRMFSGSTALAEAVAHNYAKLLAYKDEYEVARLYRSAAFRAALDAQFEGAQRIEVHLAPPLLARRDKRTGQLRKRAYGPWVLTAFRFLAPLKILRGTALDPFGRTEERRAERALIAEYESSVAEMLAGLSPTTLATAVALASLPERIRGYGHIKEKSMREAAAERTRLLQRLRESPALPLPLAAE